MSDREREINAVAHSCASEERVDEESAENMQREREETVSSAGTRRKVKFIKIRRERERKKLYEKK